jgi:flagellar basal-body rod modification protein FlgD
MEVQAASQASAAANAAGRKSIAQDFDKFLFLLTQQLKNQDPLEPMDTSEFTNQLVQFAGVEQSIKSNENLQNILELQERNSAVGAVNYIGKEVEVLGNKLPMVDGEAKFKYSLPETANSIRIEIRDAKGNVVRELEGPKTAGAHELTWDGKDRFDVPVLDGAYTVNVLANREVNGVPKNIKAEIGTLGRVTGLINLDGQTNIMIGNAPYKVSEIVRVREARISAVSPTPGTPPIPSTETPSILDNNGIRNPYDENGFNGNYQFVPYDQEDVIPPGGG